LRAIRSRVFRVTGPAVRVVPRTGHPAHAHLQRAERCHHRLSHHGGRPHDRRAGRTGGAHGGPDHGAPARARAGVGGLVAAGRRARPHRQGPVAAVTAWRVPRLLIGAAVLVIGGIACVLLGLDAAAEMPLNADRFSTLLGSGLGGLALILTGAGLVAVDGQRRLAQRRARAQQELYEALAELASAVSPPVSPPVSLPAVAPAPVRRRRRAT